jgi:phosphatidylinositol glycan class A protein
VLRSHVPPERVSVIPNAVDTARFVPDVSAQPLAPTVTIVVMSRLVYRKGVDLLLELIPAVCSRFPHVRFVVGGDGPKFALLVEMRETHGLQQRVELLGQVAHVDVCDVLNRGHIFLNMSLTETFCIALLEAASCGLLVVSTCVGGVPEVLPPEMLVLAEPNPAGLMEAVAKALGGFPALWDDRAPSLRSPRDSPRGCSLRMASSTLETKTRV